MHANPKGSTAMSRQLRFLPQTLSSTPSTPRAARLPCSSSAAASAPCRTGAASSAVSTVSTARCGSTRGRAGSRADRPTTPYRRPSTTSDGSSTRPVSNARSSSGGLTAPRSRCDTRLSTPGGSRTGAHRRCLPDHHVRRGRKGEGPHPVPSAGVDHAHPAVFGRSARMSPAESADVVIEMDAVNGELGPDFAALECPTVFVVGTGGHSGATEDEMRTVRAAAPTPRRATTRVRIRNDAPQAHADPQQGPRHRGRRDRGRHPRVFLTGDNAVFELATFRLSSPARWFEKYFLEFRSICGPFLYLGALWAGARWANGSR